MAHPGISVVILNWNGKRFLGPCLGSLRDQVRHEHEVILIDNGSTDGSPEEIKREWPWVRLEALEENLGFAGGCNRGIRLAKKEWVFLLNNDAICDPSLLHHLSKAVEEHPEYGMFSCRMVHLGDKSKVDNLGLAPTILTPGKQIKKDPETAREVFGPSGGAALIRKSLLDEVGGFDEGFFAYCEDTDLAWRLRLRGVKCRYVPNAIVEHLGSGASGAGSPFVNRLIQRNQEYVYFKNYPWQVLLATLDDHLAYNLFHLFRLLRQGQGKVWWEAKREFLRNRKKIWEKRRGVLREMTVSRMQALRWALGMAPK